jgi:hypothetical protein
VAGLKGQIAFHGNRILHVLVHAGISQKGVNAHEEARAKERPPKDTLQQPKDNQGRKDAQHERCRLLRNAHSCRRRRRSEHTHIQERQE